MSTTIITRRCSKINYFKIDPNSMYCALLYQLSSSFQQIRPLVDWRSEAYITVNIFEKKGFFLFLLFRLSKLCVQHPSNQAEVKSRSKKLAQIGLSFWKSCAHTQLLFSRLFRRALWYCKRTLREEVVWGDVPFLAVIITNKSAWQ